MNKKKLIMVSVELIIQQSGTHRYGNERKIEKKPEGNSLKGNENNIWYK